VGAFAGAVLRVRPHDCWSSLFLFPAVPCGSGWRGVVCFGGAYAPRWRVRSIARAVPSRDCDRRVCVVRRVCGRRTCCYHTWGATGAGP
jgi:hypothetical protein